MQGCVEIHMPGGILALAPAEDGGILLTGAAEAGAPREISLA